MKENKMFIKECHLAGRLYHEADEVWDQLKVGMELKLLREVDNRYDPDAVAVVLPAPGRDDCDREFYLLGYIPADENALIATMIDMGWGHIFECRISRIIPDAHYENQIRLAIKIKRNTLVAPTEANEKH